jgi:predicted nucleic acid-binding protein
VIVIDTSVIVAYMNAADDHHDAVTEWLESANEDFATTPLIVAEVDHLVSARGGRAAVSAWRADLTGGAYLVEWWPGAAGSAVSVAEQYADNALGLPDASLVVLAERLETTEVATLDERHFRTVKPLAGSEAFRLLPLDS